MTSWVTCFERCSVAWAHKDAVISFVKGDFTLQYINHFVFARMPMLN